MSYIVVEDFKLGLDARRDQVAQRPGSLAILTNGHITRGGDIEPALEWVVHKDLTSMSTFGLAEVADALYTFGSVTTPGGLPSGITYQRLNAASGQSMSKLLDVEIYDGKIYAIAQYADGSIVHWYDGSEVTDWFDGRARSSFEITAGIESDVKATGSIDITAGTSNPGTNKINTINVDGVDILGSSVDHTGTHSTTATNVAAQITSNTSSPNYTATATGAKITITAVLSGTTPNGLVVSSTVAGDVTIGNAVNMSGGAAIHRIDDITVNGVSIIDDVIPWSTSNSSTAADVETEVDGFASTPNYTVEVNGSVVNIIAASAGTGSNGFVVAVDVTGSVTISNIVNFAGGAAGSFTPGKDAKTMGSKMYAVSGSLWHKSAIGDPSDWNTAAGSGFENLATQAAGSETLVALESYLSSMAIFARNVIQIWAIDPDPDLDAQSQVLRNTGTVARRSPEGFGADVFYLSRAGVRSLRPRDSSNAAIVSDIGAPIDPLILAELSVLTDAVIDDAISIVEPLDERFWLILDNDIWVFSFFPDTKVSAWSKYEPGLSFTHVVVAADRMYARAGDKIYIYGGSAGTTYTTKDVTVRLPYLDAKKPANEKDWVGVDIHALGTWNLRIGLNPDDTSAFEDFGDLTGVTFSDPLAPAVGSSTHLSVELKHTGGGLAKLFKVAVHFDGDDPE